MSTGGLESICYSAFTMAYIGCRYKKTTIIYIGILKLSLDIVMQILNVSQDDNPWIRITYF